MTDPRRSYNYHRGIVIAILVVCAMGMVIIIALLAGNLTAGQP